MRVLVLRRRSLGRGGLRLRQGPPPEVVRRRFLARFARELTLEAFRSAREAGR